MERYKYKALMLDLDGTTIPNKRDALPSPKVTETIAKASKVIHVGVATSRALFIAQPVLDHLKLSGPSIIKGGACIIDLPTHKMLVEHCLSQADFALAIKTLLDLHIPFWIQDNVQDRQFSESETYENPIDVVAGGVSEIQAQQIKQQLASHDTLTTHVGPDWTKGKLWLSISNAKATKQYGIVEVARILNIDTKEIIGVGDGQNDFPLLMACGLKVAMGNAHPDVKAIADYIAPSVEEDGVADVIEKFILTPTPSLLAALS